MPRSASNAAGRNGDCEQTRNEEDTSVHVLITCTSAAYVCCPCADVDDYGSFAGCASAVDRFLANRTGEVLVPVWEQQEWARPPSGWPHDGSDGRCRLGVKDAGCQFHGVWWVKKFD